MLSRAAVRATTQVAGRRAFHATRPRMSSPYHYSEGPYSNIPFDPKKKRFPILFWGYCITGFSAPFLIAGPSPPRIPCRVLSCPGKTLTLALNSLANLPAQGLSCESTCSGGGGLVNQFAEHDQLDGHGAALYGDRFDYRRPHQLSFLSPGPSPLLLKTMLQLVALSLEEIGCRGVLQRLARSNTTPW